MKYYKIIKFEPRFTNVESSILFSSNHDDEFLNINIDLYKEKIYTAGKLFCSHEVLYNPTLMEVGVNLDDVTCVGLYYVPNNLYCASNIKSIKELDKLWTLETIKYLIDGEHMDDKFDESLFNSFIRLLFNKCIEYGDLEIVKEVHKIIKERDIYIGDENILGAIFNDNVDILKYLVDVGNLDLSIYLPELVEMIDYRKNDELTSYIKKKYMERKE